MVRISLIGALILCISFSFSAAQSPNGDLHLHSAVKPFNSRQVNDFGLWRYMEHDCPEENYSSILSASEGVPKFTQSNFEALIRGNVRIAYVSLTPIEKEMRTPKLFKNPKRRLGTTACISGMEVNPDFFDDQQIDYAADLWGNINYVQAGEGLSHVVDGRLCSYEIVRDKQHYLEIIRDSNKIAVLLNIEGGHALGKSAPNEFYYGSEAHAQNVLENVRRLKGLGLAGENGTMDNFAPVWFITLNHFMWNGLSGHAKTFSPIQGIVFDQNDGLATGFTPLGKKVVAHLLNPNEGRRVLVDVKHMSLESRKWYYDLLQSLRIMGDTVPIIASHVGISGIHWDDRNYLKKDQPGKNGDHWMHQWTISLSNEDVREIHVSGGILGLMLDKYRICGALGKKEIDATPEGSRQRRQVYTKLLVANMLKVAEVLDSVTAWDIISIGSDFDGMINAMETYSHSGQFGDLRRDLLAFFQNPEAIFEIYETKTIEKLMFGLSPETIVDKVMGGNLDDFTVRMLEAGSGESEGL